MPPRHVRSYSDFYRHGRRSSQVTIKKKPKKLQKVKHFSDTAILSVSRRRSRTAEGINWGRIKRWAIVIVVLSWVTLPLYVPYFRVKDITFENFPSDLQMNARVLAHDTIKPSFFVIPSNNYFVLKTDVVREVLGQRFSTVENITVTKKFPNQLIISATEKPPVLIYDNGKNYYTLDKDGNKLHQIATVGDDEFKTVKSHAITIPSSTVSSSTLTSSTTETVLVDDTSSVQIHVPNFKKIATQFGTYPIFYDNRDYITMSDTNILPTSTINAVVQWQHLMNDSKLAEPEYFSPYSKDSLSAGLTVVTNKPWVINFQPESNIQTQFTNFQATLLDKKLNVKPKQYIDVRFSKENGKALFWK
jgi:hypothetical protein